MTGEYCGNLVILGGVDDSAHQDYNQKNKKDGGDQVWHEPSPFGWVCVNLTLLYSIKIESQLLFCSSLLPFDF